MTLVKSWGRGVGKSQDARWSCWEDIAAWDGVTREGALKNLQGIRIAIVTPTRKQGLDIHAADIEADLAPDGEFGFLGGKFNRTSWRINFPGRSWIQFFGADTLNNVRGLRVDRIIVDEADDIDRHTFESVMLPWISEPWSLKQRELCGTPRRGRHGLLYLMHQRGLDPNVKNIATVHATYRDAPEVVDQALVEEARETMVPATFRREWECDFDAGEGLVYAELWDAEMHIREPDPRAIPTEVVVGVDWGWNDPNAWIVCAVYGSGNDAVIFVVEEIAKSKLSLSQQVEIAKGIRERHGRGGTVPIRFYGDPSQPSAIEQIRSQASIRFEPAANSRADGVTAVVDKMVIRTRETRIYDAHGQPIVERYTRLYVSPKCRDLIREIGTYAYERDSRDKDRILDTIADGNDHSLDALRYAIFSRFGLPRVSFGVGQRNILNV